MYDELIEELRRHHCDAKEDDTQEVCEECAYDVIIADKSVPSGIASVCVCGLMNRAADVIEGLSHAVDQMTEWRKNPWIPVTERLPEKTGKYLVCGQWRGKPAEIWVCELIALGKIKGWANEARNPVVTHWMPLPEPPGATDINVGNKFGMELKK